MLDYQQTINFLFEKLPMFSRLGAVAYKGDLTNTIKLCQALGDPQHNFRSIHVAGTNGKGSVSHMLAAVLQTAGYKTGLHTSPHLKDFRERIRVNGEMISKEFVVEFTENIKPQIDEIEPSFFEITVAMAFSYFARQRVDIAIIEVGLGGRLDSTNVITPELSVITNIGYDHVNILGDTLQKIAFEKAGIIKPDVPVVIGEVLPDTKPIFQKISKEVDAPIIFASERRWIPEWKQEQQQLIVTLGITHTDERRDYRLDLTGLYQAQNLVTVIEAIYVLRVMGWKISPQQVDEALLQVKKLTGLHGRWEVIHHAPLTVLDVAHNADGMRQVVSQLEHCTYQKLHVVIGMVNDKDISKVLSLLPQNAVYYFTKAQIPRALPETELADKALGFSLTGKTFPTVQMALQHAADMAHPDDMILVCGSVFVVGEVEESLVKW